MIKNKREVAEYDEYSEAEYSEKYESIKMEQQIIDFEREDSKKEVQ